MAAPTGIPPGDYVPTADQRIVLGGFDWAGFQKLIELRGDRRWRIAYLDGAVELMSPSQGHESVKGLVGRMVEWYCLDRDIPLFPTGAWLIDDETEDAGAEPDESYLFGPDPERKKPRPDLVIEVAWSRGGLKKLEIYRRLVVPEVWIWKNDAISIHQLGPAGYEERERSAWMPDLDVSRLCELSKDHQASTLNEARRAFVKAFPAPR